MTEIQLKDMSYNKKNTSIKSLANSLGKDNFPDENAKPDNLSQITASAGNPNAKFWWTEDDLVNLY